jgi:hypothetical protein
LIGVRYARDRCGHQLAMAALEDGLRPPRLPNAAGAFFRWRPSGQLPQPVDDRRRQQAERIRLSYDLWPAGRPAEMSVDAAAGWFAHSADKVGV